jgi:hypothetical protein
MRTYDRHFKELFGKGVEDEGFQEVKGKKFRVIESWLRGAPKKLTSNRPVAQLSAISLREMSELERGVLHKHWIEQRSAQLTNDLIHALDSYHGSKSALDRCHRELGSYVWTDVSYDLLMADSQRLIVLLEISESLVD